MESITKKFLQWLPKFSSKTPLIFIGGRNNILDPARLAGYCGYQLLGILDQYRYGHVSHIHNVPIIGDERWLETPGFLDRHGWPKNTQFIVTSWWDGREYQASHHGLDDEKIRRDRCDLLDHSGANIATLINPNVWLMPDAVIGRGVIIMTNSTVSTGAVIGDHCFVDSYCHISYGTRLGRNCIVGARSLVAHCLVGDDVRIGINCTIDPVYNKDGSPGEIGDRSVIHMGAVVPKSVPPDHMYSWHGRCFVRNSNEKN